MNAGQKQMLVVVGLIGAVVLVVWLGWRGTMSANSNGGFKPAPTLSRAQQTADAEKNVKYVQSDPNMSDQAKQIAIGMIRAHEPAGGAKSSP